MKIFARLCFALTLLFLLLPGCAKTAGAQREDGLRFLNPGGMRGYRFLEFLGEDVWEKGVCVAYLNDVTVPGLPCFGVFGGSPAAERGGTRDRRQ